MMGVMFAAHTSTSSPHLATQWVGTGVSVMMKQPEEPSEEEINVTLGEADRIGGWLFCGKWPGNHTIEFSS